MSVVTDASGNLVSRQEFDPWGKVRAGGSTSTSLNYTGQRRDDTGLLFYNARYYDPQIGRFISADTIVPGAGSLTVAPNDATAQGMWSKPGGGPGDAQALNRYSYVESNPVGKTDPTGHAVSDGNGTHSGDGIMGGGLGEAGGGGEGTIGESLSPPLTEGPEPGMTYTEGPNGEVVETKTGETAEARNPADIEISEGRLRHVVERHTRPGLPQYQNKSKFSLGENIDALVEESRYSPAVRQMNGNYARVVNAGRIVGVDRITGQPTQYYTVVTDSLHHLVTAYPGMP